MINKILCIAFIPVFSFFVAHNVIAADISIKEGAHQKVCKFVLKSVKTSLKVGRFVNFEFLPPLEWEDVSYTFKNTAGELHEINGRVANIDINNDGNEETIMIEESSFKSNNVEFLFVFPKGKAPSSLSTVITLNERSKWDGIYSFIPWPYAEKNLAGILIYPFIYEGVTYIALKDVYFAYGMKRPLLVVKYRGRRLVHDGKMPTDDFETVCTIK